MFNQLSWAQWVEILVNSTYNIQFLKNLNFLYGYSMKNKSKNMFIPKVCFSLFYKPLLWGCVLELWFQTIPPCRFNRLLPFFGPFHLSSDM